MSKFKKLYIPLFVSVAINISNVYASAEAGNDPRDTLSASSSRNSANASNHSVHTIELQDVLLKEHIISGRTAEDSRSFAYDELHKKLFAIVDPNDANAVVILANKPADQKTKFCSIVRTLVNFVGWNHHAFQLLTANNRNHSNYLSLIDLAEPHETEAAEKRNLVIAKAKLRLLILKYRMHRDSLSYDAADAGAVERKAIYDLLTSVTSGIKVRLVEKAYLIIRCGYSSTGDEAADLALAQGFLNEYTTTHSNGGDGASASSNVNLSHIVSAAPYLSINSQQSRNIRDLASQLVAEVSARQARLTQPDQDVGGDANVGSDEGKDDDGHDPVLLLQQQADELNVNVDNANMHSNDNVSDDAPTTLAAATQSKDERDIEGEERSQADNDYAALLMQQEDDSSDDDSEISSSSSSSSVKRGKKKTKEEQEAHYAKIREAIENNPDATHAKIAEMVGNGATADSVKIFASRHAREFIGKQKRNSLKIQKALEDNPGATYIEIAAIAGVTKAAVTHHINRHAPEYKKHKNVTKRRSSAEIETIYARIKQVIDDSKTALRRKDICSKVNVNSNTIDGFYAKYPDYRPTNCNKS